jgi:four helix bundle protein
MKMYEYSFEKLDVWKKSRKLVVKIYKLTKTFPEDEKFGLVSQMRRAAVSVTANIAEGSSRFSKKDQSHFYQIGFSSLIELLNHLYISLDLEYLTEDLFSQLKMDIVVISRMLNALYNS